MRRKGLGERYLKAKPTTKKSDKQRQTLQSETGSLVQVPGMVKGEGRLRWAGDWMRDEKMKAEAGNERMDLIKAVTEECLNKDGRINLLMELNPGGGGKRWIWGYKWRSHYDLLLRKRGRVDTEVSKITMGLFGLWGHQWKTSCLRLSFSFLFFFK